MMSVACCDNECHNSIMQNIIHAARTIKSGQWIPQSTKFLAIDTGRNIAGESEGVCDSLYKLNTYIPIIFSAFCLQLQITEKI